MIARSRSRIALTEVTDDTLRRLQTCSEQMNLRNFPYHYVDSTTD